VGVGETFTVSALHVLGAVKIGAAVIGGITAQDHGLDTTIRKEATSGELQSRIQSIVAQKASPTFTTLDISTALTACGSLGLLLTSVGTPVALAMYAAAKAQGAAIAANGHKSYTYNNGLLIPKTLSCSHQGDAQLSYAALPIYDGVNGIVVVGENATLPTIAGDNRWTIKSVSLGGATIGAIGQAVNVSIDFGIQAASEGALSDIYDSRTFISAIEPTITVTSTAIPALAALLGASGAASIILRKRVDGGTFATGAGSELTLAGTGLATFTKPFGASGNQRGEMSIQAHLKFDGTNAPITATLST